VTRHPRTIHLVIGGVVAVTAACATPRRPTVRPVTVVHPAPDAGTRASMPRDSAARDAVARVDSGASDPLAAAEREVRAGQPARTIVTGGATIFPFGHGEPTIACAILRVCAVSLEPGERVLATATGDSERWEIVRAAAGPDGQTPLVLLKPSGCALTTNLVVATDRRIYALGLTSAPCAAAAATQPSSRLTPLVRFWYPDRQAGAIAATDGALAFTYHWTRDPHAEWTPVAIYDDGRHVHIVLPSDVRRSDAPVLWERTATGDRVLMNYTVRPDGYVTDRVFARASLEFPDGAHPHRVEIVNDRLAGGDR